ncbi:ABC transporter substrate-binding protein [Parapedobacter sp.]
MLRTRLSLHSILSALDLDTACLPLLEEAPGHEAILGAHTPHAVYAAIRDIGNILRVAPKANQLAEDLEERINIITHKLKFITDENKPHVVFIADIPPVRPVNDAYLETITRLAGGIPVTSFAEGAAADVMVVIGETPMQQLIATLPTLIATPEWTQTKAVKQGNVYIIHHPDHLRQPGALIADDIEILAEIFHPKQFIFGRDGDVWMKFEVQ